MFDSDGEDVSFGLDSSDVAYLDKVQLNMGDGAVNPETDFQLSTCDPKGDILDIGTNAAIGTQNTDQFVQMTSSDQNSAGQTLSECPVVIHETQSVCNPVTVSGITTNTVNITNSMLSELTDLRLIDVNNQFSVQNVQLTTGETVPLITTVQESIINQGQSNCSELIQVPVQVASGGSTKPEMYVLKMTMDDGQKENDVKCDKADITIGGFNEAQRSSTPNFEGNGMDETILSGNVEESTNSLNEVHSNINTVPVEEDVNVPEKKNKEQFKNTEDVSMKKTKVDEDKKLPVKKKVTNTDQKVKLRLMSGQELEKARLQEKRNKTSVADLFTSSKNYDTTHNVTYCKDWVSKTVGIECKDISQNDTVIEQDSCDSKLLNVTSITHNLPPKVQKITSQVEQKKSNPKEPKDM